jgi:hypothetical protein
MERCTRRRAHVDGCASLAAGSPVLVFAVAIE